MTAKKVYKYLLIAFALGLVTSVLLLRYANNWLTEISGDLTSLRTDVEQLEQKRLGLEEAKKTLNEKQSDIETLAMVIPTDKDQARIIKEIYQIAAQSGISIDSVGFPASTLGTQTIAPPAATTPPATDDGTTTTAPAAPKAVSQATPVKEIPGVQSIELTIGTINSLTLPSGAGVRYDEMITFLKLLERNQRTIQIRSIGIGQRVTGGEQTYNLDVSLTIFIRA